MPFYQLLYLILAIIGLGFLVFIHELGHYFVAKRCGMKIQVFSIGFGKPFYSWMRGSVKWQLCYCLIGGYVKIAGMQKEGRTPPHKVKNGYYSKSPRDRIAVAFAGPIVNLIFAFVAFTLIWVIGGRVKSFSEYTQLIGAMDAKSALYEKGVHSGDQIKSFNGKTFNGMKDLTYTMVEKDNQVVQVVGDHIDYYQGEKTSFDLKVQPYPDPRFYDGDMYTLGILRPASFLLYDPNEVAIPKDAPILDSGIEPGDRIVWADGRLVFSQLQLSKLINQPVHVLSVRRGNATFLTRLPKLKASQLGDRRFLAELEDWSYALDMRKKVSDLYFIPYSVSSNARVEQALSYIDDASEHQDAWPGTEQDLALKPGDQITAVDGVPISSGMEALKLMQSRHVQLIVQRNGLHKPMPWTQADQYFETSVDWKAVRNLTFALGSGQQMPHNGSLYALKPIKAVPFQDFPVPPSQKARLTGEFKQKAKEIEKMDDEKEKEQAEKLLAAYAGRLMIGVPLVDQKVIYNPGPWALFEDTLRDIWRTLTGLFSGALSPKWVAGPVGIVQMLHHSWGLGFAEALFWLGVISLNLGILNLLPIPPFDGGHIVFSFMEGITGKRVNHKVMDRVVLVFVILLIGFALYITFNDVLRLVGTYF